MEFSKPVTEIIRQRFSCRTYKNQVVPAGIKDKILSYTQENSVGPFGGSVRFHIIENLDLAPNEQIGTYGFITGASAFLAGAIQKAEKCFVDYGFIFEKLILYITDLGLGTCWLGGTLDRTEFVSKMELKADEIIPAVSPVGFINESRSLKEKTIRFFAGSAKRKPWTALFFDIHGQPLSEKEADSYTNPLEMVRLAPSASNKQPWRVIYDTQKQRFHFFLERSKSYDLLKMKMDMQGLDAGIALCHFELTAREAGLKGKWEILSAAEILATSFEYIVSWIAG
ncbi:nitroreductase [candidate division KSB1 bacterium]|nr:nitroreductase [candidate division KSB1 bacterium]